MILLFGKFSNFVFFLYCFVIFLELFSSIKTKTKDDTWYEEEIKETRTHVSSSIPIRTTLLSADQPRRLRLPNSRQAQGHHLTDEQCFHIRANLITYSLRINYIKLLTHYTLKTLLRRFPCGCNLNIVICNL